MRLSGIVFRNQIYYARKTLLVVLLSGLILLIPAATILFVNHIRSLADRPLAALNTELILQLDQGGKKAAGVHTKGLVEPFNLHTFNKETTEHKLGLLDVIDKYSTALVLWQFDPQNPLTVVGLDPEDASVGLRKIESLLMKNGRFFSDGNAAEVILERHYAKLFGHKPGGLFNVAGHDLKIIGLVDFKEQSNLSNVAVFLPYETALSLSRQSEKLINQVFLSLASSANIEQARQAIARSFPGYSLLSKDSLYKNLSAFNQLIYRGGHYMILAVIPLALLLLAWTLKIHRLESADQVKVLKVLGWPRSELRCWLAWDIGYLLTGAVILTIIASAVIYWGLLPHLEIAPLLDQGFKL